MIKLSICIPTYNEEKNIGRLLDSILKSEGYNLETIEIIVVNSVRSTDKTEDIAKSYSDVIYNKFGNERSPQRNKCGDLASGEYLYFVDCDMEFSKNLLVDILNNLETDKMLVVPERIPGNTLYCKALNIEKACYDGNDIISAARIFLKTKFNEIGGYNTEMVSGEDWDLDKRLKKIGLKIKHIKTPIYHHEESVGFVASIKKKIYYAKQLKNYKVAVQAEVNPIYRYSLMFKKPLLSLRHPIAFVYLLTLKTFQYGIGYLVYIFSSNHK